MKTSISLTIVNLFVIVFLFFLSPNTVNPTEIRNWDDDWVPCDWIQSDNYFEHECYPGYKYVSCLEQSCVGQPGWPID